MARMRIGIIGAGGFAREVRWLIEEINDAANEPLYDFAGYVVEDASSPPGTHDCSTDILGDEAWLAENPSAVDALALGIGTPARGKIAAKLSADLPDVEWPGLVHPNVRLDRSSCEVGEGVLLCAGVIATVNVTLAPFAMVNLACTLGHEARLGRGVCLNPTVNISGGVTIEDGALVGTGAQILQYITIGAGATVGAGSVVTKNVKPGVTVIGIPARAI